MNTATGVPLLNPSKVPMERIEQAEGILEEIEHLVKVGYQLDFNQILERVKGLIPLRYISVDLTRAFLVVLQRNLARGYYWSDRMVWICLRDLVPEFKDFIKPHLLILGTSIQVRTAYKPDVKRDCSVLVHSYLLRSGKNLGVVLPYTVRHHIQKFIFYWKTPDVKYEPSWVVKEDVSDRLLNMFRFSTEPGANPTQGPLREEDPFIHRARQQISQILQRPQLPQQQQLVIDSSETATRLVETFTSPSQRISAEAEELERREREHRQALNDKFNALSRFPLR